MGVAVRSDKAITPTMGMLGFVCPSGAPLEIFIHPSPSLKQEKGLSLEG